MMTEDRFWQIIQRSFDRCDGDIDEQEEALAEELEPLPPKEIAEFQEWFDEFQRKAYTWELWGAAYIIGGGCSDDGFMDFRSWLISRGREWYLRAMKEADALADYPADLEKEGAFFEEFAYVAIRVHEEKEGDMPRAEAEPYPAEPAGEEWPEGDEENYRRRWPRLFEKYWGR